MLPTPDTSHVPYERVYEPAEDSFLLLDTLSSASETTFLTERFSGGPAPLAVEVGTGSGVVLAFLHAQSQTLLGTRAVLTAGIDMNAYACRATRQTVQRAEEDNRDTHARGFLSASMSDLTACLRAGTVDVLIFNPPYVPTSEMPVRPDDFSPHEAPVPEGGAVPFDHDSYLLSLSYAGGRDGMETTDRLIDALPHTLSPRGCAYILFCAQNKPDEAKAAIVDRLGPEWKAETVGSSGKTAGREKLQIVRIWRG